MGSIPLAVATLKTARCASEHWRNHLAVVYRNFCRMASIPKRICRMPRSRYRMSSRPKGPRTQSTKDRRVILDRVPQLAALVIDDDKIIQQAVHVSLKPIVSCRPRALIRELQFWANTPDFTFIVDHVSGKPTL